MNINKQENNFIKLILIYSVYSSIHIAKFSRLIFFVLLLTANACPAFCEENQLNPRNEFTDKQYKDHINEFQRTFGKKMENEFGLKLARPDFPSETPEFYAYRRATLEEARALALGVIRQLSEAVQTDPIMMTYFSKPSSFLGFLRINITFVYSHNWCYCDGSIDNVHAYAYRSNDDSFNIENLYLQYNTTDPFGDLADRDSTMYFRITESFQDAVRFHAENPVINPAIHNPEKFEDELNQILTSFIEKMEENDELSFWHMGWMIQGQSTSDISKISAKCTHLYPVDCQEARALVLQTTKKLLAALNNSEILKPYLSDYPLPTAAIKLRILFRKEGNFSGQFPYDNGSLESAVLSDDSITYYYLKTNAADPRTNDRVVYAKESYQEAQKNFENTPSPTIFKQVNKEIKSFIGQYIRYSEMTIIIVAAIHYVLKETGLIYGIPVIMLFIFLRKRRRSQRE